MTALSLTKPVDNPSGADGISVFVENSHVISISGPQLLKVNEKGRVGKKKGVVLPPFSYEISVFFVVRLTSLSKASFL